MKTNISLTPSQDAGAYIEEKLHSHKNEPIMLIISGGSSLAILDHIAQDALGEHITVGITDERYTQKNAGSNFASLQGTQFYARARACNVTFINPRPRKDESHEDLALRVENAFRNHYLLHPKGYSLGIFGIGEDGHTASIFPETEAKFNEVYRTDSLYISVVHDHNEYPQRTTITPAFIEMLDDIVLFAVGSNKCDNILNYMHNMNFTQYQIPALIPAQHPQSILFTDCTTLI